MTIVFRIVLWTLGVLLAAGSRASARVRSQLGREFALVVESADGVARTYFIEKRRVSSRSGATPGARCTLRFRTAAIGTAILLASNAADRIFDGLRSGDVECEGQAAYVLWFYQLAMGLNPLQRRPRQTWPDAYVVHDPGRKAAKRITREPAVDELDPSWSAAHRQREKLLLWEVGRGAEPSGVFTRHRIVVDPAPDPGQTKRSVDSTAGLAKGSV